MVISVHWLIRSHDLYVKEKFLQKERAWAVILSDEDAHEHTNNHLSEGWKRTRTGNACLHDQLES